MGLYQTKTSFILNWSTTALILFSALVIPNLARAADSEPPSSVGDLINRRLYKDAVTLLQREIQGKSDQQVAQKLLQLGDCLYMQKQYSQAKPYLERSVKVLDGDPRLVVAEYRLASTVFHLADYTNANRLINEFVNKKYPNDARAGTLLLFQMKIAAQNAKPAQVELEALHQRVQGKKNLYGASTLAMADKILTDFFLKTGQKDLAIKRYSKIVFDFRNLISENKAAGKPIPNSYEQTHDDAAMQLGMIAYQANDSRGMDQWFGNVRYIPELVQKAKLMLAQSAYNVGDYNRALQHLMQQDFLETVPPGQLRSDMCLLIGFCLRAGKKADPWQSITYFKMVEPNSKGYFQAQIGMAEIFLLKNMKDQAISAYNLALESPKYAPVALFHLLNLKMKDAAAADERDRKAIYKVAAGYLEQLLTKYPLSGEAKRVSEVTQELAKQGFKVLHSQTEEDKLNGWTTIAASKKGSFEGAQALLNLVRYHQTIQWDEKQKGIIRAPDYAACARSCDELLDPKVYDGKDFSKSDWEYVKAEVLFYRGYCEMASTYPKNEERKALVPSKYVEKTNVQNAIKYFREAKSKVNPKQLDLVKSLDLGLLEGLLKSDNREHQDEATKLFESLEKEYGTDKRFQKLALDLAEWYNNQGRYAEAAKEYRAITKRSKDLPRDEMVKILFLAGSLYSKAAREDKGDTGKIIYAIYIHPEEVIKLGGLLETHAPFSRSIEMQWPQGGDLMAGQALTLLSQKADIPFVWANTNDGDSVMQDLSKRKVRLKDGTDTIANHLKGILNLGTQRLALDIGLANGKPTITPKKVADPDDPDKKEAQQVIEIYDVRTLDRRFAPLAQNWDAASISKDRGVMAYSIFSKIEEITGTRLTWAEGIEKQDLLAKEFDRLNGSLYQVLTQILKPANLNFRVDRRDFSREYFDEAKACFNEIRKFDPISTYGEKSLFTVALNYYHLQDYEKMKVILKEYLKMFDDPSRPYYHQACFWVGWVFEREKEFREACNFYSRAAEEQLTIYKPGDKEIKASREELKKRLSYDSLFALETPLKGSFDKYDLEHKFLDYIRINTNLAFKLDSTTAGIEAPYSREPFVDIQAFDVLWDALEHWGLSIRSENVDPKIAERAYLRLATAYKKDDLMAQALENCQTLLARYPKTERRLEITKLRLDIYKGLKNYRMVLEALEELKAFAGKEIELYQLDYEIAWVYFDICHYAKACEHFKKSIEATTNETDRVKIRDGFARSLYRADKQVEALVQYEALAKEETEGLRVFIAQLMEGYLKWTTGKTRSLELPREADLFIKKYENCTDEERKTLTKNDYARATWIYYIHGLAELRRGSKDSAIQKLTASSQSPDDMLAAEAMFRITMIHMEAKDYTSAIEAAQYMLFSTKATEPAVRGTFLLGQCLEKIGRQEQAQARYDQILARYPDSPYAELINKKANSATAEKEKEKEKEKEPNEKSERKP